MSPVQSHSMARYTLVYGVRLIPEGTLKGVEEATLTLADGSAAGLTLHTFDGTIPQLRRSLDRSLDAFFDLLPGADDEDVEKFGGLDARDMLRAVASSPLNILLLVAPVSWVLDLDVAGLALGLPHRRGFAGPARRPHRPGHRAAGAARGPGLGGLPERHVRQRRRADHRHRRAAQRTRRAGQGVHHRQHHRQPAARARPLVLRRRPGTPLPEVSPHRGHQHDGDAVSRASSRSSCRRSSTWRSTAVCAPQPPALDRLSFWSAVVLIVAYARQPDLRLHRAARSVPRRGRRRITTAAPLSTGAAVAAARGRHAADDGAGGDAGGRPGSRRSPRFGFTELFVGVIVVAIDRQRRRALLGRRRGAPRRDDAGGGDRGRQQRADRAARGARGGALLVRHRPADVAAVQRVRDRGDRAVGARDLRWSSSTARATGWKGCS